jgi:acyl carrier protein
MGHGVGHGVRRAEVSGDVHGGGRVSPREIIRAFIVETFLVDDFPEDASFLRTGIIDSMGMARLVAFLEEAFQIAVADDELVLENLDSLQRVAAFVGRKLSRNAA